jgi:hypothetical protein
MGLVIIFIIFWLIAAGVALQIPNFFTIGVVVVLSIPLLVFALAIFVVVCIIWPCQAIAGRTAWR